MNGFNEEETGRRKREKRGSVVPVTSTSGMSRCMKKLFEILLNHLTLEKRKAGGKFAYLPSTRGIKGSRHLVY